MEQPVVHGRRKARTIVLHGQLHLARADGAAEVDASMRLRGNMGVGANVIRTSNSVRGVLPMGDLGRYVTNDYTTFDISATAFAGMALLSGCAGMRPAEPPRPVRVALMRRC